jgi:hypothetical protein
LFLPQFLIRAWLGTNPKNPMKPPNQGTREPTMARLLIEIQTRRSWDHEHDTTTLGDLLRQIGKALDATGGKAVGGPLVGKQRPIADLQHSLHLAVLRSRRIWPAGWARARCEQQTKGRRKLFLGSSEPAICPRIGTARHADLEISNRRY